MSDHQVNLVGQVDKGAGGVETLGADEISQLLLASSLSTTRPLLGVIKFLVSGGIVGQRKLKSSLGPILVADGLPTATKAMLDPMWKSLIAQI